MLRVPAEWLPMVGRQRYITPSIYINSTTRIKPSCQLSQFAKTYTKRASERHMPCGTMRRGLKHSKEPLPIALTSREVYRVNDIMWNIFYLGETGKISQSRISEHWNAAWRRKLTSLIWFCVVEGPSCFSFDSATVIDYSPLKGERLVKES